MQGVGMSSFESKIMATLQEDISFIKKKPQKNKKPTKQKHFEEITDNYYTIKL